MNCHPHRLTFAFSAAAAAAAAPMRNQLCQTCHLRRCSIPPDRDWIGWRRPEDPEPAILSSSLHRGPAHPKDAIRAIEDAQTAFEPHGARVEYCRSRGIDYERSMRYLPILEKLERAIASKADKGVKATHSTHSTHSRALESKKSGIPYLEMQPILDGAGPEAENQCYMVVKIEGMSDETFEALVRDGRCPLCEGAHLLSMCPLVPNEIRPFC